MDYIKNSSFPILASTNCSPTKENFSYPTAFDKTYLRDPFTGTDAPLAAFECFGRPLSPKTATESLNTTSSVAPIGPLLETPLVNHSFYQLNPFPYRFPWDANPFPAITDFDLNLSVLSENSHTPSLYDDAPQPSTPASPTLSPHPKLESHDPLTSSHSILDLDNSSTTASKRRRGRPRLDRSSTLSSTTSNTPRAQRVPHNQVERKYREGLNATIERLRQMVPVLCTEDNFGLGGKVGQPKPSKAMILDGAIEYIREVERERDSFRAEVKRLRRETQRYRSCKLETTSSISEPALCERRSLGR